MICGMKKILKILNKINAVENGIVKGTVTVLKTNKNEKYS